MHKIITTISTVFSSLLSAAMLSQQIVSVTDLKRNASGLIKSLKKEGNKIIFVNNKPVAVLADIDQFNLTIDEPFSFHFGDDGIDPKEILDQL